MDGELFRRSAADKGLLSTVPISTEGQGISGLVSAAGTERADATRQSESEIRSRLHLHLRRIDTDSSQSVQILSDLQSEVCQIVPEQEDRLQSTAAHIRGRRRRLPLHAEGENEPVHRHQRRKWLRQN